jgi:hypothetical protein
MSHVEDGHQFKLLCKMVSLQKENPASLIVSRFIVLIQQLRMVDLYSYPLGNEVSELNIYLENGASKQLTFSCMWFLHQLFN